MALLDLFSPAGGLSYHLIASRRSRTRWLEFRSQVREWLKAWRKQSAFDELIVFGPSAGWTLPLEDLSTLRKIIYVEPDPLARWLLRRRSSKRNTGSTAQIRTEIEFLSDKDFLPWFAKGAKADHLKGLLLQHPHAAILFSNVLGQIPLLLPRSTQTSDHEKARAEFFSAMENRNWASYHDLFSAQGKCESRLKVSTLTHSTDEDFDRLAQNTFSTSNEVTDHEMQWLSTGRETRLALWPITEGQTHLIGFVRSDDGANPRPNKANR